MDQKEEKFRIQITKTEQLNKKYLDLLNENIK